MDCWNAEMYHGVMDCWNAEIYHGATASEDLAFWT